MQPILVTGAGGKTGRAVVRALARRRAAVRALVRRPHHAEELREAGAAEVVIGDLLSRADLERAAAGARALYHICPNVHPAELAIGATAIEAARAAGVALFAYHSVLHPQTEAMPHHWRKLRVEERLFEAGVPFVILQPAPYMQNVLSSWRQITMRATYPVPYALATRLGMVDLEDVAEAAAIVLTEAGHDGATYELAGPEALDQMQIAAVLGEALRTPVVPEVVPLDQWTRQAEERGLGPYQIETLVKMFRYYERFGLWGNSWALRRLLGRNPTTFAEFAARTVRETRG